MRPNLALGPIDSVLQYLLYLSIVVFGVLLPVLVQKWRTRREKAALLARTLASLSEELKANRRRIETSRDAFKRTRERIKLQHEYHLALRARLVDPNAPEASKPPDEESGISMALLTDTAWDVARLADALVLIPADRLAALTRAYRLQDLFFTDRQILLRIGMRGNLLDLPLAPSLEALDRRLEMLTEAESVLRYYEGLSEGMITAYDTALGAAPQPPSSP